MNPVEQVIAARKSEFTQAMTAHQQAVSSTAFQDALSEQTTDLTQTNTASNLSSSAIDQQLAYAQTVYEAILAKGASPAAGTTHHASAAVNNAKATSNTSDTVQPASSDNNGKYQTEITAASKKYGVSESLIRKVIEVESNYNPNAVSSAGATGLMQLMYGENRLDPAANIDAGVKQLSGYIKNYDGDLKLALAAYNAGPGNVRKYGGVPPFTETQNYIKKILGKDVG